jgi:putative ABC transport system substrate-binding protein
MRRREFLGVLGGAAASAFPLAARAQDRVRRIGVLVNLAESDSAGSKFVAAFRQSLQELGWVDGRNTRIDMRWGAGDRERYRMYAAELAALRPDVIFVATTDAVVAVQQASPTVPIVFVGVIDPVGSGLVASMARPAGNATGFSAFEYAIAAKWLELLKEVAPCKRPNINIETWGRRFGHLPTRNRRPVPFSGGLAMTFERPRPV